jgi:hypothetical protein
MLLRLQRQQHLLQQQLPLCCHRQWETWGLKQHQ